MAGGLEGLRSSLRNLHPCHAGDLPSDQPDPVGVNLPARGHGQRTPTGLSTAENDPQSLSADLIHVDWAGLCAHPGQPALGSLDLLSCDSGRGVHASQGRRTGRRRRLLSAHLCP